MGEAEPRTIVSGLVKYVPMDTMINLPVVAVCNLKPFAFRGVKSYGMLLCVSCFIPSMNSVNFIFIFTDYHYTLSFCQASHMAGKEAGIEIVQPPQGSKPGDRIYFEGFEDEKPLP